jgi:tRNA A37 threonylcarbamoyladenosine synthetase subunit TsaC/SUA5/YrdC
VRCEPAANQRAFENLAELSRRDSLSRRSQMCELLQSSVTVIVTSNKLSSNLESTIISHATLST